MELGQTEAFCTFDDHHRGVGYVHADFYDRGGHEDVRLAVGEELHVESLVLVFLLSVHHCRDELRRLEIVNYRTVSLLEILVVECFGFFDKGIYDECLTALADFAFDEVVHPVTLSFSYVDCLYRLAARGKFVYHGYVQVTVQGHGQCTRNGCGRHDEDVRRLGCFESQSCPLVHTETVLLVDDYESEAGKDDVVLYDRVGAYQNLY